LLDLESCLPDPPCAGRYPDGSWGWLALVGDAGPSSTSDAAAEPPFPEGVPTLVFLLLLDEDLLTQRFRF